MVIKKRNIEDRVFRIILFVLIAIFASSFIFILLWITMSSFRTGASFARSPFNIFGFDGATLDNYVKAFTFKTGRSQSNMIVMFVNSLVLIVGCTFLNVFIPSITGYVVSKYKFRGAKLLVNVIIITMVIPTVGTLSATYKFINEISLYDTFFGVFLLNAGGFGFNFLLFKNYFSSIPTEYKEAACIDGAGNLKTYFLIMLPQAKPIIVSVAIMSIIGVWNDFFTAYLYLPSFPTVALGVNNIYSSFVKQGQNYPVIFAAMVFTTGIVLIVYAFFSNTIMTSMSAGGLKG